jgi:HK97 family phage major capsid protein
MDNELLRQLKEEKQLRYSDIVSGSINQEERTVDLSFSSELAVERHFGMEILDHSEKSCDLSRLNKGGAVLVDHSGDQVGVVKKAFIDPISKRGMAKIKFSKSARGQEIFQDIVDGIRSNISFSYKVNTDSMVCESDRAYRMMNWTPLEISVVGVPADATVGIGRSLEQKPEVKEEEKPIEEVIIVEKKEEIKIEINEVKKMDDSSKKRMADIFAIAEKHPELMVEARAAVMNETSLEDFQRTAMEKLYTGKQMEVKATVADIGLSKKEERQYSIVAGIRDSILGKRDSLEFEASRAVAKKLGKDPQGFFVPNEILNQRTMNVTTAGDGGNLVATDLLSGSFIDILRNKMVMAEAGAQFLSGLVGDVAIPKQTGSASAYWVAEGIAPTVSTQAIGQVALSPSTVGAFTDYTRKLLLQSSIGVEQFIRNDLASVLALELDRIGLHGSGAGAEPTGLYSIITGGYVVALGVNGAAPTWAKIVALESVVDSANAAVGNLSYIGNAKVRGTLKTTVKASSYPVFIMDDNGNVNGYPCRISNQVISNISKAGGSNLSAMFFGNFNDAIYGLWGALDIMVDPYTFSNTGSVRVVALQDADFAVRHVESFSAIKDMVTI